MKSRQVYSTLITIIDQANSSFSFAVLMLSLIFEHYFTPISFHAVKENGFSPGTHLRKKTNSRALIVSRGKTLPCFDVTESVGDTLKSSFKKIEVIASR